MVALIKIYADLTHQGYEISPVKERLFNSIGKLIIRIWGLVIRQLFYFRTSSITASVIILLISILISGCESKTTARVDAPELPADLVSFGPPLSWDYEAGKPYPRTYVFKGDTPVRMADGSSKPLYLIRTGDSVLAAGPDLQWGARQVTHKTALAPSPTGYSVLSINYSAGENQKNITMAERTVLIAEDRRLFHVERFIAGDRLMGYGEYPYPVIRNIETDISFDDFIGISTGTPSGQGGTFLVLGDLVVPESSFEP